LSPQGCTNEGETLDLKLGACTLILPSGVWAAEPHYIDSCGEHNRKEKAPPPLPISHIMSSMCPGTLARQAVQYAQRTVIQTQKSPNQSKFSTNTYPGHLHSSKGEREAAVPSWLVNQTRKRLDTESHTQTPKLKTKAWLAFSPSQL